ncbi:ion channel [Candidatus Sororendozoicomonas aggregata]|uniref:ion channel n=1 Tax=Candidatus Sororendozoicomonas aggregata TaxID=3073239 RepID=UPI002ED1BE87
MESINHTIRFLYHQLLKLSWLALMVLLLAHYSISWLLFLWAGETTITRPENWFYYYVTTATTVGYGDLSPDTVAGRFVAAGLLMPGSVVFFAALLGKFSSLFINVWRKGMQGKADYSGLQDHVVILGWHPEKTKRMVQLIYGDARRQKREVVLCTDQDMENPFPDRVCLVQGERLTDEDVFHRAGIEQASRIIIHQGTDDQTLAACLSVSASGTNAHIVAWFEDAAMAALVKTHCPKVECHTSIAVDLLVRSAQDPGSSRLQSQLLSTLEGPTQFSVQVPDNFKGTTFGQLMRVMKNKHEAIALGVADTAIGNDLLLNPPTDYQIRAGQLIYFMAQERIKNREVSWKDMT